MTPSSLPSSVCNGYDLTPLTAADSSLPEPDVVDGRFVIPWQGFTIPGANGVMKFLATSKDESNIPPTKILDETFPVVPWDSAVTARPPDKGLTVTWIGHSTVLVQMDNLTVLTDPVFSDYCGPVRLPRVPVRYRPVPCTVSQLPHVDAVVISHNHFDHLDCTSVTQLNQRFGSDLCWFVPSGLRSWMHSAGCQRVVELSWWKEHVLVKEGLCEGVRFACVPAQHWTKRGVWDDNKTLWGGWCIIGPRLRFYFAGDTGYNNKIFKQIGARYGPFDFAALPVGAYSPRWFMQCQHVDPKEAWQIHQDVGAYNSIGIHWGTFKLSHEFYLEPRDQIKQLQEENGAKDQDRSRQGFFTTNIGQSMQLTGWPSNNSPSVSASQ